MKRKLYEYPQEFLEENREFFLQYEAATQLNSGNALAHSGESCSPALLFGRYEENGKPVLLFGNMQPFNICLNAPFGCLQSMAAAAELARFLKEAGIPINGVNARKDLCDAFLPAYGGDFAVKAGMDIMVLEKLVSPAPVPGQVRKAVSADLPLAVEWGCLFQEEALHEQANVGEIRERLCLHLDHSHLYFFETPEGRPVSMAASSRQLPHGSSISWVYTPREHRGQGYAQSTVAEICREILERGNQYCTLFVDKANPISNRVYEKIGFHIQENCYDYRLKKERNA